MGDPRLQPLSARNRRISRISHDINQRNPIQPNHLLKIDITSFVAIDVLDGETEVRSVRVGLEDVAPVGAWWFRGRHVEEDRVGPRFEDGVCLGNNDNDDVNHSKTVNMIDIRTDVLFRSHVWREQTRSERPSI